MTTYLPRPDGNAGASTLDTVPDPTPAPQRPSATRWPR
jgi:hypothetical protein